MVGAQCPAAAVGDAMPISNIPILSMLRTRMQWHQERQRLLAENVANADTPNFRPRDLTPPKFDSAAPTAPGLTLVRTDAGHIGGSDLSAGSQFQADRRGGSEVRPAGNAVNLEDEMIKVAANQMDYQAATTLYGRSLGLIKTAVGRG
jgi:flagellar basal-body rod protein FlgB